MIKVKKLDNGVMIEGLITASPSVSCYDAEAKQLLMGLAEAYGFAPQIQGLMLLAFKPHDKMSPFLAEHDELTFGGGDEQEPSDEEQAMMDQYGWFWSEYDECWKCFT
jgi:hypothetical protein